ncbi:hypothetical protein [Asticcacaulis excentricus]|nr:hypothetical protein [Asticcacaulis excentricus]
MSAYSADAVEYAQERFGVDLDFSADSVARLENLLVTLHKSLPKGRIQKLFKKSPTDEEIRLMSKVLGAYLGEVIRRNKGGEWASNEQFDALGLYFGDDKWVFPVAKVHKRLMNGEEDNVFSFYQIAMNDF